MAANLEAVSSSSLGPKTPPACLAPLPGPQPGTMIPDFDPLRGKLLLVVVRHSYASTRIKWLWYCRLDASFLLLWCYLG